MKLDNDDLKVNETGEIDFIRIKEEDWSRK